MTQPRSDLSPNGGALRAPYDRWSDLDLDHDLDHEEITGISAFDDFDALDDLDFGEDTAFDGEVLDEPDANDTARRRGQHRKTAISPAKGRVLIAAMAAGAAAAAAHSAITPPDTAPAKAVLTADKSPATREVATAGGMQMITVRSAGYAAVHDEELAKGVAFAQERAEREARLQRPLFVMPTRGIFTSNFGYRWGVLHAGIDIANSIGTPILAVSDGVVVEAGPAAGYGMLVKLRHTDGTVTLYGHVNTTTVSTGERVTAGDQIATMGNRGNSTGPHLHFEVMLNGTDRVDPLPWLAKRGLSLGN